jgi:DNA-binding NtrC family response regulator
MAYVLVVNDKPIVTKVITTCLELDQHQVRTVSDLSGGLELLQRNPPDLIVTDLLTDAFSPTAFGTIAALRRAAPATPIVLATAHAQAAAYDPVTVGVAAIIVEPFRAYEFRSLVARVLAERRTQLQSLESRAEQTEAHLESARQHVAESLEVLRQVSPAQPPAATDGELPGRDCLEATDVHWPIGGQQRWIGNPQARPLGVNMPEPIAA